MKKIRSDAWTENEDNLLAQTVLQHIREGDTQLNAFEIVGEKLNRTAAACGFRWNSNLRKKYVSEILHAKQIRQEVKKPKRLPDISTSAKTSGKENLNINTAIAFLKKMRNSYSQLVAQVESLKEKLAQANNALKDLHQEREQLIRMLYQQEQQTPMEDDDYKALLSILLHANRLMEQRGSTEITQEKTG